MKKHLLSWVWFVVAVSLSPASVFSANIEATDVLRQAKVWAEAGRYKEAIGLLKTFDRVAFIVTGTAECWELEATWNEC